MAASAPKNRGASSTVSIGGVTLPKVVVPNQKKVTVGGISLPNITPTKNLFSLDTKKTNREKNMMAVQSPGPGNLPVSKIKNISADTVIQPIQEEPTSAYKWNLPPHAWSLPVDPSIVDGNDIKTPASDLHSTRRGRIFMAQPYVGPSVQADAKTGNLNGTPSTPGKYGFQFMWNPETFSQNTSVNMQVTPSGTDATSGLTSFVAANSNINFTLRIDRTNDFACFNAENLSYKAVTTANGVSAVKDVTNFVDYYAKGKPKKSEADFSANIEKKILELLRVGTASDLEFLYRSINGDGFKKLGQDTSEIGYLRPSLIRLDLGPQKYIGIIQTVNVNHLAFTKDMVPIRTDVTISVDLRAGTGYTTSGVSGSTVPQSSGGGK
jgi:hypothetical protein